MTVLDTSGAIDFLLGEEAFDEVADILSRERTVAAPDLIVSEVTAVLRRHVLGRSMTADRAQRAIVDLGDIPMDIYPTLPIRERAWELRENLTAADALFVALAERLDEPLATKDRALAVAARARTGIRIIELV